MKTTMKKFISVMLCALFVINLVPASAFATYTMNDKAEEALAFVESKGFAVGDVQAVYENGDYLKFDVKYLSSGETSYIEYTENNDGIRVVLTEGNNSDTIIFKYNGDVYWDENEVECFNEGVPSIVASYASGFFDTIPPGCSGTNFSLNSRTSDYISLAKKLSSYTASGLATTIVASLNMPSAVSWIFLFCAEQLISDAISAGVDIFNLNYTVTHYKDNTNAPLQYHYKHDSVFSFLSYSRSKTYYETENLL